MLIKLVLFVWYSNLATELHKKKKSKRVNREHLAICSGPVRCAAHGVYMRHLRLNYASNVQ